MSVPLHERSGLANQLFQPDLDRKTIRALKQETTSATTNWLIKVHFVVHFIFENVRYDASRYVKEVKRETDPVLPECFEDLRESLLPIIGQFEVHVNRKIFYFVS